MGEIPGTAATTSSNSISSRSTTEGSTGEIGTKGGCKRGAACQSADVGGDASGLVSTNVRLYSTDSRDEGTGRTGREVAAARLARLADGRDAIDRLARVDASIGRLVS